MAWRNIAGPVNRASTNKLSKDGKDVASCGFTVKVVSPGRHVLLNHASSGP